MNRLVKKIVFVLCAFLGLQSSGQAMQMQTYSAPQNICPVQKPASLYLPVCTGQHAHLGTKIPIMQKSTPITKQKITIQKTDNVNKNTKQISYITMTSLDIKDFLAQANVDVTHRFNDIRKKHVTTQHMKNYEIPDDYAQALENIGKEIQNAFDDAAQKFDEAFIAKQKQSSLARITSWLTKKFPKNVYDLGFSSEISNTLEIFIQNSNLKNIDKDTVYSAILHYMVQSLASRLKKSYLVQRAQKIQELAQTDPERAQKAGAMLYELPSMWIEIYANLLLKKSTEQNLIILKNNIPLEKNDYHVCKDKPGKSTFCCSATNNKNVDCFFYNKKTNLTAYGSFTLDSTIKNAKLTGGEFFYNKNPKLYAYTSKIKRCDAIINNDFLMIKELQNLKEKANNTPLTMHNAPHIVAFYKKIIDAITLINSQKHTPLLAQQGSFAGLNHAGKEISINPHSIYSIGFLKQVLAHELRHSQQFGWLGYNVPQSNTRQIQDINLGKNNAKINNILRKNVEIDANFGGFLSLAFIASHPVEFEKIIKDLQYLVDIDNYNYFIEQDKDVNLKDKHPSDKIKYTMIVELYTKLSTLRKAAKQQTSTPQSTPLAPEKEKRERLLKKAQNEQAQQKSDNTKMILLISDLLNILPTEAKNNTSSEKTKEIIKSLISKFIVQNESDNTYIDNCIMDLVDLLIENS